MEVKSSRHARYQIAYHFVWIPKYRRVVLKDEVAERLIEVIHEIADKYEVEILALEIQPDHVHLFVSAPPRYSPANLAKLFKGGSGRRLLAEFPELKTICRKDKLWAPSYYVGTAGNVSSEVIKRYIKECQKKHGV